MSGSPCSPLRFTFLFVRLLLGHRQEGFEGFPHNDEDTEREAECEFG